MYQHNCIWQNWFQLFSALVDHDYKKKGVIVIAESLCFNEIGNSKVV